MTMVFKRSDTKPEIDPSALGGTEEPTDGDGWLDGNHGPNEPDPPYSYDDGNTYDDLGQHQTGTAGSAWKTTRNALNP